MKLNDLFKFSLMLFCLSNISAAISVSCASGGSGGAASISTNYNLDSSTSLIQSITTGPGVISSVQSAKGSGTNSITQTAGNQNIIVSSSIASTDNLASTTSSYASENVAGIGQTVHASGQSKSSISALSNSLNAEADQEAGVLSGAMASSQMAIAGDGSVSALQASNLAGALGYTNGAARSSDNTVKMTGGLNGIGDLSGFIGMIASDSVSASGSIKADSLESKAYSAVKSTSTDGDVYSYLSSTNLLSSSIKGAANDHVSADQILQASGDVMVYAGSTTEDSTSKSYAAKGEDLSGSMSVSAGSPAIIETDLEGDVHGISSNLVPTPGSWVLKGGLVASNAFRTEPFGNYASTTSWNHTFVVGTDKALYDLVDDKDWYNLGGYITSNICGVRPTHYAYSLPYPSPSAIVFARGGDNALWAYCVPDLSKFQSNTGKWTRLGGHITSSPSATYNSYNVGYLYPIPRADVTVAARGSDGALWLNEIKGLSTYFSDLPEGNWEGLGGYIAEGATPSIFNGGTESYVRGGDNGLWANIGSWNSETNAYDRQWYSLGGYITSDPDPITDPNNYNNIDVFARGSDGALWVNSFNEQLGHSAWTSLGGYTPSAGSVSSIYTATPDSRWGLDSKSVITFVRGGDGNLWQNEFNSSSMNFGWYNLGGFITSDPIIYGRTVSVRGSDGALWQYAY